jgi:hypothetical protein
MTIEVKTVRFEGALRGLRELPDADQLIVHIDQTLVVVPWPALRSIPDHMIASAGSQGLGKVLATEVRVDNAWTVHPETNRILLARQGELEVIDPSGRSEVRRIAVTGMPRGTFAAGIDSAGQNVLLAVMRAVNPDFAEYGVAMANLTHGQLIAESTIGSIADLELLWDNAFRGWLIVDTGRGTLWHWDGMGPAVRMAGPDGGRVHAATITANGNGVFVSAVLAQPTGETDLITGRVDRDRVAWAAPVVLSGFPVLVARRHPTRSIWACLAQQGAMQQIRICDAAGKVLAEAGLGRAADVNHILWSTFSPKRVWGIGTRALTAATVNLT